jgi:hypothetical protein
VARLLPFPAEDTFVSIRSPAVFPRFPAVITPRRTSSVCTGTSPSELLAPHGKGCDAALTVRLATAPTARVHHPVAVNYRSHRLRYANGNIFAAVELALERPAKARTAPTTPPNAIKLGVVWRGPKAARLPRSVFLTSTGVYTSRRFFPLKRGPWCYLAENLQKPQPR